jgi:pimeloyl-ACP methyl ester carboxylesterase
LADGASETAVALARELALSREVPELVRAIEAIRDRPDSTAVLATMPVVLAQGAGDIFFPVEDAQAFVERAPDARLVVFDRSRHLPNLEQPDEFNETLLELLGSAG